MEELWSNVEWIYKINHPRQVSLILVHSALPLMLPPSSFRRHVHVLLSLHHDQLELQFASDTLLQL